MKNTIEKDGKHRNKHLLPPWKKGQSGNPNGRPKKQDAWADMYNDLLDCEGFKLSYTINGKEQTLEYSTMNKSIRHMIVTRLIFKALGGDIMAIREITDRTIGKPKQYVEIGEDDVTVTITPPERIDKDSEPLNLEDII